MIGLVTSLLLLTTSAESPQTTPADDCDALYYALGRAKDLPGALRCYTTQRDFEMQITMLLNSEGAAFDPTAIDAAFAAWKKDDEWNATQSMQAEALTKAYTAHRAAGGKPVARLEFCTDIAGDTIHMNQCQALAERRETMQLDQQLQEAKAALPAPAQAAFDPMVKAYRAFEKAEGLRLYQAYIDGTIRNAMAMSQEGYVRSHFQAHVDAVLKKRHLDPISEADFTAADAALNQAYRLDLRSRTGDPKEVTEYDRFAKLAERAWIEYRDAWGDLILAISTARKAEIGLPADDVRAIKAWITRDRIDELKHDPGAGN